MKHILFAILLLVSIPSSASDITVYNGTGHVTYSIQKKKATVVDVALEMFEHDIKAITGKKAVEKANGKIEIYQLDQLNNKEFARLNKQNIPINQIITKPDAFYIGTGKDHVVVVGSNGRGTAYGILELSRLFGVSAWEWWGDVTPNKKKHLSIPDKFSEIQVPDVEYRGLSLRNTQWSLQAWSRETMDAHLPEGAIGARTYKKVFELMLRLRLNVLCPPLKEEAKDFFLTKGNREVADSCSIIVLTEHSNNNHKRNHSTQRMPSMSEPDVCVPLSHCGYPHDYLWLPSLQPGRIYAMLQDALQQDKKHFWVAETHNPKTDAYGLSLFSDLCWHTKAVTNNTIKAHLRNWISQQFGKEQAERLLPVMTSYYRLTAIRKPEYMGWNVIGNQRDAKTNAKRQINNTEFHAEAFGNEIEIYLQAYEEIIDKVNKCQEKIDKPLQDAFFAMIKYPVLAAHAMAEKILYAQEARSIARPNTFHNDKEALHSAVRSWTAYKRIEALTDEYNKHLAGGKWRGIMSDAPRELSVFAPPILPDKLTDSEIKAFNTPIEGAYLLSSDGCIVKNAYNYTKATKTVRPIELLGHSLKAIQMDEDDAVVYDFHYNKSGEAKLLIAFAITNDNWKNDKTIAVQIDNREPILLSTAINHNTSAREKSILRGQVVVSCNVRMSQGTHKLAIKSLSKDVFLDQWMIDSDKNRQFYVFPIAN